MLGKPTLGSMIALKRVTRHLKRTRDFVNKLELDSDVEQTRDKTGWVFQTVTVAGKTDQKVKIEWSAFLGWSASLFFQLKTVSNCDELWNG